MSTSTDSPSTPRSASQHPQPPAADAHPPQAFAKAAATSLLGLALQLFMGVALLIYAFIAKDKPGLSGAAFILCGVPVWIILAVLFDQHRRQRLEALEAEAINASLAGRASAFGEAAQELHVAAKRLAWMHRILVPILSILLSILLGGLGLWFWMNHKVMLEADIPKINQGTFGWSLAIGIGLLVIGFVFARYVAGLAKHPAWGNLRGGASMAVAAAIVGGLLTIAHFAQYLGFDSILRYLHFVFPAAMILIAAEFILNFLLSAYRPRTTGEIPRPAIDSRILAFVAAPDRLAQSLGEALNYQFGFRVTDSWFYQLVSRYLAVLVCLGILVVWMMTSLAVVAPNEQAIVLRFGRQRGSTLLPGLHLKAPWPIDVIETIDATTVRTVQLANDPPKIGTRSVLWTNDHGVVEVSFAVQPSDEERTVKTDSQSLPDALPTPHADASAPKNEQSERIVRDLALVSAEIPLFYVVDDYAKFRMLAAPEHRDNVIRSIGRREVLEYLSAQSVDQILGEGRVRISNDLFNRISARLKALDAGVSVRFVGLTGVHPPRDTAPMFESVVQSVQQRSSAVQAAKTDAEATLIAVAGSVDRAARLADLIDRIETEQAAAKPDQAIVTDFENQARELLSSGTGSASDLLTAAAAERWNKHMAKRAEAARFDSRLALYQAGPEIYRAKMYYDTLAKIVSKSRVYIVADKGEQIEMRLNLEDSPVGTTLFDAPKVKEGN